MKNKEGKEEKGIKKIGELRGEKKRKEGKDDKIKERED